MKLPFLKPLPLSRTLSLEMGTIHLVGIGGIGMSGIAEILHNLGYKVQGSDMSESANTERLKKLNVRVMIGHDASQFDQVQQTWQAALQSASRI